MEISQMTRIVLEREELEDVRALAQYADDALRNSHRDKTPEFEAAKLFKFEARTP